MPLDAFNQAAPDALLQAADKSYFTNVGYTRTAQFQVEYRDVDPQNTAQFGSTVQFVIPKSADLLGPMDLIVELKNPTDASLTNQEPGSYWAWVESLGYAMIEKMTFSVGSHDVESITGEEMNIMNELNKSDEGRLAKGIMKTGLPAVPLKYPESADSGEIIVPQAVGSGANQLKQTPSATEGIFASPRLICWKEIGGSGKAKTPVYHKHKQYSTSDTGDSHKLTVPLSFFFTKHPSRRLMSFLREVLMRTFLALGTTKQSLTDTRLDRTEVEVILTFMMSSESLIRSRLLVRRRISAHWSSQSGTAEGLSSRQAAGFDAITST